MNNQLSKQELEQYWEGLKLLIDLAEGDYSMVAATIDDVLEHTPTTLQELREGLAEAKSSKVQLAAHSLKSSMMLVGADDLSSLCQQLESDVRQNQLSDASTLGDHIFEKYGCLQGALLEWKKCVEGQG